LLQRLFVVEAQPAWAPGLRSRARLRRAPKLHLTEPALAAAVLGADQDALTRDLATLGLVFESAAVHDLTTLASPLGGEVSHYRDSNGHEIGAVIVLPDGRWAAAEVKLGGLQAAAGARSLARAVGQIDTARTGEPSFRLVLTGTGSTLVMSDGTLTCPLSALAP
jgi:predicted AAA+ superfamily ATPase